MVLLHTCSLLADYRDLFGLTGEQYLFYRTVYHLMRWAVPCFFMITGALLVGRSIDYPFVLKKYVFRMSLALLIFGIPFGAIKVYLEEGTVSTRVLVNVFLTLVEGQASAPLWYLYALIGIYFILPVLNKIIEMPRDVLYVLVGVLFCFDFILPFIADLAKINIAFYIPIGYTVFYVLTGYCVKQGIFCFMKSRALRVLGTVVPFVLLILSCIFDTFAEEMISYQNPLIALCSICIFASFMFMKEDEMGKRVWKVDRLCFGVYLIHPALIQLLYRFLNLTPVHSSHYILATVASYLLISLLCFFASWLMNLIIPLKRYVL